MASWATSSKSSTTHCSCRCRTMFGFLHRQLELAPGWEPEKAKERTRESRKEREPFSFNVIPLWKDVKHYLVAKATFSSCLFLDATTPLYCNQEGKSDQLRKVVHYLGVSEVRQNHLNVCFRGKTKLNLNTNPRLRSATDSTADATCLST